METLTCPHAPLWSLHRSPACWALPALALRMIKALGRGGGTSFYLYHAPQGCSAAQWLHQPMLVVFEVKDIYFPVQQTCHVPQGIPPSPAALYGCHIGGDGTLFRSINLSAKRGWQGSLYSQYKPSPAHPTKLSCLSGLPSLLFPHL